MIFFLSFNTFILSLHANYGLIQKKKIIWIKKY